METLNTQISGYDTAPDFIIGITREIWEDRRIHALNGYYAPDIVVRSPASIVVGNQAVIAATMSTLSTFPDRMLLSEDVIWTGSLEQGMLSSHRILSKVTHTGNGIYGDATGKTLSYRIIADCHARNSVIDDEWLIRDQGAIVRQLGKDVRDHSRELIASEGGPLSCVKPLTPETDMPGPYEGKGNDSIWGERLSDLLVRIMGAEMSVIPAEYDRACELAYPGGLNSHGTAHADMFWMGLRASFPSARFTIHHAFGMEDSLMSPRASVRWSLWGKHSGWGVFGRPTDAMVYVLGITQAEFGPWGLRREFTLYDETAIWKQILLKTGALEDG